ncbi:MAG: hypothetical protein ACE5HO_13950 [bacterium]
MQYFLTLALLAFVASDTPLTNTLLIEKDPCWSPDGERIAYVCYVNGAAHLWRMDGDGKNARQLTFGNWDDRQPYWSPDGQEIVYVSTQDSGRSKIVKLNLQDRRTTQITFGDGFDTNPAWSPDGRTIAFSRAVGKGNQHLWLVQPDGTGLRQITDGPANEGFPSWSPEGRRLAFVVFTEGYAYLCVAEKNHWNTGKRITAMRGRKAWPGWAPDGKRLIYSVDEGKGWNLWMVNADGTAPRQVTFDTWSEICPAWHPVEDKIAFVSTRKGRFDIWLKMLAEPGKGTVGHD